MEKFITFSGNKIGNIVKWKIKKQSAFSNGTILCLFKLDGDDNIQKLKATEVGTVVDVLQVEGASVKPGSPVLKVRGCQHPIVMKDMCAECGADLREALGVAGDRRDSTSASVAMVHSVPELIVSEQEAVELGKEDESRLLSSKKLVLLVDLDETLLHTTNDNVPDNLKDVYHFQLWHGRSLLWYHTKFRPGTKKFLDSISKLYELHICTFGARMYAHTMARYLDPEGKYFSHRILSRDECFDPRSKTANLKSLFPCGDGMVCIIDDREEVWNFVPNLIQVKPYIFFDGTADINAPPGLDKGGGNNNKGSGANTKPKRNVKVTKVPKKKPEAKTEDNDGKKLEGSQDKEETGSIKSDSEKLSKDAVAMEMELSDDSEAASDGEGEGSKGQGENLGQVKRKEEDEKMDETTATEVSQNEDTGYHRHKDLVVVPEKTAEKDLQKDENKKVTVQREAPMDDKECIDVSEIDGAEGDGEKKPAEETKESVEKNPQNTEDKPVSEGEDKKNLVDSENKAKEKKEGGEFNKNAEEFEEIIEWEDSDDYLLHLEDILTRIHTVYYDMVIKRKQQQLDQKQNPNQQLQPTEGSPDLKKIIPYVKKKVLQGSRLVFSSVVPTNQPLEKSRAFQIAKSLGAEVQKELTPKVGDTKDYTTHLVAAKLGTQKVKAAMKMKGTCVVTPDWLWSCNERWDRVDERLFLLDEKNPPKDGYDSPVVAITSDRRKRKAEDVDSGPLYNPDTGKRLFKKARSVDENKNNDMSIAEKPAIDKSQEEIEDGTSMETEDRDTDPEASIQDESSSSVAAAIGGRRFSETINPLYTFSLQDRVDMDKEVAELLDDESDSQDSHNMKKRTSKTAASTPELEDDSENSQDSEENEQELRRKVLGHSAESSSEDSMSGDFPKGWKKKQKSCTSPKREYDDNSHLLQIDDPGEANLALLKAAQSSPHYLFDESDSDSTDPDSIGSADEEMAAALENILYK